jgi:hypothetical protein
MGVLLMTMEMEPGLANMIIKRSVPKIPLLNLVKKTQNTVCSHHLALKITKVLMSKNTSPTGKIAVQVKNNSSMLSVIIATLNFAGKNLYAIAG